MLYSKLAALVGTCTLCSTVLAKPVRVRRQASGSLDNFVATESPIALQGVLDNLGPDGSQAPGTGAGLLIASPSTENPNCEFVKEVTGSLSLDCSAKKTQPNVSGDVGVEMLISIRLLYVDPRFGVDLQNAY